MRPARLASSTVNLLPWYHVTTSQPSRATDKAAAIARDIEASMFTEAEEEFIHRECTPGECSQAPKRRP